MLPSDFLTLLHASDTPALTAALRDHPDLAAARDPSGLSAILWTLYNRKPDLTALLVAASPPLDIFEASAVGDATKVSSLIDQSPDAVRAFAPDGFTPLHLAAFFSRADVVHVLLAHGADVHAVARNPSQVQPLHSAAAAGAAAIVEALLVAGADANARQHGGFTPIHSGAMQGNLHVIGALIAHGADPTAKADDGRTARDMAGDRGDVLATLFGR